MKSLNQFNRRFSNCHRFPPKNIVPAIAQSLISLPKHPKTKESGRSNVSIEKPETADKSTAPGFLNSELFQTIPLAGSSVYNRLVASSLLEQTTADFILNEAQRGSLA